MTTDPAPRPLPDPVVSRPAVADDTAALTRLWLLFRHDMSAVDGTLPAADGSYRSERLDRALDPTEPSWQAWMLHADRHPVGFAVARALDRPTRVLTSFFLVAPARGRGLGTRFARHVVESSPPGPWSVAYQEHNRAAAGFWPALAARYDPGWRREERAVPGREPDTWLTFEVGG